MSDVKIGEIEKAGSFKAPGLFLFSSLKGRLREKIMSMDIGDAFLVDVDDPRIIQNIRVYASSMGMGSPYKLRVLRSDNGVRVFKMGLKGGGADKNREGVIVEW